MPEHADAFVFFGATGDLAKKMIFPSLYRLVKSGRLTIPVIGVAFSHWGLDQLKDRAKESITAHGGIDDQAAFDKLISLLRYIDGDYADAATFTALRTELGAAAHPVHYLAIPPSLFGEVVTQLGASGCATGARVVVEKPFGHDLASAQALNGVLRSVFAEADIMRIDHFLGERSIQNALYIRMANSVIEDVFDRQHVDRVQITMAEDFGVDDRGAFYDAVGCLLDVVENHIFQIVSILAMDAPAAYMHDALRDERARLFESVRPIDPADLVRGQYDGYRAVAGVAPDSDVETYTALKLFIDSERWSGVPFIIRAGKKLPVTITEAVVEFHDPPLNIFEQLGPLPETPARLRFRFHPTGEVAVALRTLSPGDDPPARTAELTLNQIGPDDESPYERLLGAAIECDPGLFVREDTVESCWRIVDRVLTEHSAAVPYEPGSWGPAEADAIAGPKGWAPTV